MNFPSDLKYTKSHEWVRKSDGSAVVGITDYAQHEISDVVYIELPKVGQKVEQGKAVSVVESVKAAFDIYAPVSGVIKKINTLLESDPALINKDPYGKGWMIKMKVGNAGEVGVLLNVDAGFGGGNHLNG